MGVNTVDDLYGVYWERRNLDLSYIMLSWQYALSAMPPTSIVRSTGTLATGTSASMLAIRTATTSTLVDPPSTLNIVADMLGT